MSELLLINITGPDKPGLTSKITAILADARISVLDIGQAVIHNHLSLGMLVEVPEGLPSDKSPTRHAQYRWLGEPDDGMKAMLQEQLKRDPNWY